MRIRPTTAALAVGLSGLLAASSVGPAAAVAALTEPEAKAIANAGVVQQGDLPAGYFPPPTAAKKADTAADEAFYACLGTAQPTYLARNQGAVFVYAENVGSPGGVSSQVDSSAGVTTAAEAIANQTALRSEKGAECFRQQLAATIARSGAADAQVGAKLEPVTVKGADEAWAYHFAFAYSANGQQAAGNGYLLGVRVGQALLKVTYAGGGRELTLAEAAAIAASPAARAAQVAKTAKTAKAAPAPAEPAKPAPAAPPTQPGPR
ncbi:MAG: hypothetical protein ACT4QF_19725 [Sporichthyaceae bacterium]